MQPQNQNPPQWFTPKAVGSKLNPYRTPTQRYHVPHNAQSYTNQGGAGPQMRQQSSASPAYMAPPAQYQQPNSFQQWYGQPAYAQNPAQNGYQYYPAPQPVQAGSRKLRSLLASKIALVAGLPILLLSIGALGFLLLSGRQGAIAYTDADLSSFETGAYSSAYPSLWTDISSEKSLQDKIAVLRADVLKESKAYAHEYDKTKNTFSSVIVTGYTDFTLDDSGLRQVITDSASKTQFETALAANFAGETAENCQSVKQDSSAFGYGTQKFTAEMILSYTCVLSEESQQKTGTSSVHFSYHAGIRDKKVFMTILSTNDQDWQTNKVFYTESLLAQLQAK